MDNADNDESDNEDDNDFRFNAGAGKFGSAFAQEDGVVYREESVGNNERVGQYSYIGDDGKTYTVKYSAGVNGFRSVFNMLFNHWTIIKAVVALNILIS